MATDPMVTAADAGGQNPYQTSAGMLGNAGEIFAGLGENGSLANINKYIDPYYESVIDSVLGRVNQTHEQGMDRVGDQAAGMGAFGGSRQALLEAKMQDDHQGNVFDVSNQMYSDAFNRAGDLTFRDQMASAQGQTQLGKDYYNIGNANADRQMQAGNMQQDLWQQILTGETQGFQEYLDNPYKMIDMMSALMGNDARRGQGSTTQQSTPGLFDYLGLVAQAVGG